MQSYTSRYNHLIKMADKATHPKIRLAYLAMANRCADMALRAEGR